MQTTNRLSRQITLAFTLFGAALILVLGLSLVAALKTVEHSMLDDTLRSELAHFRSQADAVPNLGTFQSRTTIVFAIPLNATHTAPEHIRDLSLGFHDITHDGYEYRVLVEKHDNVRYAVQFEDTNIRQRERQFVRLVSLSSLIGVLLAFSFGWLVSRRVSGPIRRLAAQVTALEGNPAQALDVSYYREDEIGLLARRLKHYHEQLRELLAREKEFAGNVSHELRTPLTNISLAAEVLASKPGLDSKVLGRIQRIQRATGEMSELVEAFLVLAQMDDSSPLQYSACDLRPIVDDAIEQQRVWLGDKPIQLVVTEHASIHVAAPARILSVLIANLVRNAFRYTQAGQIHITLSENRLCISDTGVGIDAATQPQLFERHVRGVTGDTDGAGLGLSIVKRICERYGWDITVQSEPGQGSTFTVHFTAEPT